VNNPRFYAPIAWVILLFIFYAVAEGQRYLGRFKIFKKVLLPVLQIVATLIVLVGISHLHSFIQKLNVFFPCGGAIPIVIIVLCMSTFIGRLLFLRNQGGLLAYATLAVLTIFTVFCNQFTLSPTLAGTARRDIEFKFFIDWYRQHAQQGETVMMALPEPTELLAPELKGKLFHTGHVEDALTFESFTRYCLERNITYVTWDSRIGYAPHDTYYKLWRIEKITPLAYGRTTSVPNPQLDAQASDSRPFAAYQYLTTLGKSPRFIHVYRLVRLEK
jgi:hypothetical protein